MYICTCMYVEPIRYEIHPCLFECFATLRMNGDYEADDNEDENVEK